MYIIRGELLQWGLKIVRQSDFIDSPGWGFFGGGRSEDIMIPWERVKKIGVDVILVDAHDIPEFNDNPDER